jgi:hypothetical protein
VCWFHGGAAPQVRQAAADRLWLNRLRLRQAAFIVQGMREYDALTPEQKVAAGRAALAEVAARLSRGEAV